jgi:hypothetical protein
MLATILSIRQSLVVLVVIYYPSVTEDAYNRITPSYVDIGIQWGTMPNSVVYT